MSLSMRQLQTHQSPYAITGREAAEEQERDEAQRRRWAAQEAQEEHDENSFWAT